MPAVSMEALLSALMQGSSSPLLGLVHVLLLRQAQADMEISHATGCLQVCIRDGWQRDSTQLHCDNIDVQHCRRPQELRLDAPASFLAAPAGVHAW